MTTLKEEEEKEEEEEEEDDKEDTVSTQALIDDVLKDNVFMLICLS
jgi:hypothetical protein